jgi:hypothetical protein
VLLLSATLLQFPAVLPGQELFLLIRPRQCCHQFLAGWLEQSLQRRSLEELELRQYQLLDALVLLPLALLPVLLPLVPGLLLPVLACLSAELSPRQYTVLVCQLLQHSHLCRLCLQLLLVGLIIRLQQ